MNYLSKITQFFNLCLIIILFVSCSDTDTMIKHKVVPYVKVNEQINLIYYYKISDISNIGNSQYFKELTPGRHLGYLGHGIIVTVTNEGYKAYDATCTLDVHVEEHLEVDGLFAVCPICESKFNILTGWPFEGSAARYQLKEYKAIYNRSGKYLTLRN